MSPTILGRRGFALLALCSLTACAARGDDEVPISRGVGLRVEDFTLRDVVTGKEVSLYSFAGKKAAVIVFLGTDCPVGDLYMPRLKELAARYGPREVVFLGINANLSETPEQIAAHAREFGVDFPVLKDRDQRVADALLAARTCEALVVDGKAVLRYRGAIDDQYGVGTRRPKATREYLVDALEAVLAGRPVDTTATTVVGCPIERGPVADPLKKVDRVRAASPELVSAYKEIEGDRLPDVGQVTYWGHVAAILQEKCQSCHRPGEVAPFALMNYRDARRWATSIEEVVAERRMPPWHADPRHGEFANDRSLSPRERATLLAWVEQGAPEGDPALAPSPRSWPEGWTIGTPDVVFETPEFTVKAQGVLPYQRFRVPTNFTEDKWIQAGEARPGDRSVVHHIIVYIDDHTPGSQERLVESHLCGYAPGDMPSVYPHGVAKKVPAGSDLIFEMHYTPVGRMKVDRSKVGLVFAKEPVKRRAYTLGIANAQFEIPPGDPNYEVRQTFTFQQDAQLLSFMPHMHLRGKDFMYTAIFPDGRREVLLSVPAYDFGWQSYYTLKAPMAMPKGTRIECVAHFDNSAENPANPDPTKAVTWGEQTWDEMMIGYIDFVPEMPAEEASVARRPGAPNRRGAAIRRAARALGAR